MMKKKRSIFGLLFKLLMCITTLATMLKLATNCGFIEASANSTYNVTITTNRGISEVLETGGEIRLGDSSKNEDYDYDYILIGFNLKTIETSLTKVGQDDGLYTYRINENVDTHYINIVYEQINYAIIFEYYDENGITSVSSQVMHYGEIPTVPEVPEMQYGTFLTWDKIVTPVSESIKYKAVYSLREYTVNYIVNGEVVKSELNTHFDEGIIDFRPELDKYYKFAGWALKSDGDVITSISLDGDLTLYAIATYDNRTGCRKIIDTTAGILSWIKVVITIGIVISVLLALISFVALLRSAFGKK